MKDFEKPIILLLLECKSRLVHLHIYGRDSHGNHSDSEITSLFDKLVEMLNQHSNSTNYKMILMNIDVFDRTAKTMNLAISHSRNNPSIVAFADKVMSVLTSDEARRLNLME